MAGATNQWTATAAITGAGGWTAGVWAAAVGRYCHLRGAPGICLILQCKITKVVERPGVHYRGRHSPWISSDRDGSFLFGSTPARIFDLLSFSSHEPRSVNSRFDGSKRRKQGLCARTHRMHRYHLLERFLLLFLITGRSLLLLVLLCIGCWKCTIYCQSAKNDFRFTLRWYSILHCYCSSFDFICFDLLFSIFAYQEPLFFFLFSTKGGFSMCVSVTIYLSSKGGRCWGFESRGGGTD